MSFFSENPCRQNQFLYELDAEGKRKLRLIVKVKKIGSYENVDHKYQGTIVSTEKHALAIAAKVICRVFE